MIQHILMYMKLTETEISLIHQVEVPENLKAKTKYIMSKRQQLQVVAGLLAQMEQKNKLISQPENPFAPNLLLFQLEYSTLSHFCTRYQLDILLRGEYSDNYQMSNNHNKQLF